MILYWPCILVIIIIIIFSCSSLVLSLAMFRILAALRLRRERFDRVGRGMALLMITYVCTILFVYSVYSLGEICDYRSLIVFDNRSIIVFQTDNFN